MKLSRLLGVAVVGVGAATVADHVLRERAGDPSPPLPGTQQTYRWRGMDVAYVEAGDPDDRTIVMLHGINAAGSSHEFREVFGDLAANYHVVAPDLPGFGHSDRPPLRYSAALYEDFVEAFLAEYDAPAVVASSVTAAYVAADADHATDLLLICPTTESFPGRRTWLRELLRSPVVGTSLYNLMTARPSIRHADEDHGYYDPANVTDDLVEYQWRIAHREGARFAPAAFFAGDLNSEIDLGATLAEHDATVTLLWGRESTTTPLSEGRALADAADARLVVFDHALLQPHVEHAEAFVELVEETV
ncbi:MAG: alpha/beta fold hydrolase [Haloferacaceae archaeon]